MRGDAKSLWGLALVGILAGILAGCGEGPPERGATGGGGAFDPGPVPREHAAGADLFLAGCTGCHGRAGAGFAGGPPLLDTLYLADRFPDSLIHRAILRGAPRRHWHFDDMPAVRTVRADQVPAVAGYLRWVQHRWTLARDSAATAPASSAAAGE